MLELHYAQSNEAALDNAEMRIIELDKIAPGEVGKFVRNPERLGVWSLGGIGFVRRTTVFARLRTNECLPWESYSKNLLR